MPVQTSPETGPHVVALAGGVGAARFLAGLVRVVPAANVTAVVNTGDDQVFHGLHVSPDLDTVTYTLAGAHDAQQGWGLAGETFRCMDALERYTAETWFRLGDTDLATHLYRTRRLAVGASLTDVTREIAGAWGVETSILPMSNTAAPTVIDTASHGRLAMQEWFVRHRAGIPVRSVDLTAAGAAPPAPGVIEQLAGADVIVICPSNPVISIGPVLAVPGIRETLAERRDRVVGISPIVGGRAIKGPADRMLEDAGIAVSAAGVAGLYADACGTFVIDETDQGDAKDVEATGCRVVVTDTIMRDPQRAAALATACLEAVVA